MRLPKQSFALGLTVTALGAFCAGTATAAPIEGTYEPSGPFRAVLEVYPHNPDAAQNIFSRAATRDPESGEAFVRWATGNESGAVPTCPGGDIANCDLGDFLDEIIF